MEGHSLWRIGYIKVLVGALLFVAIIATAAYAHLAWTQSQDWMNGPMMINVVGEGEVIARPDIGSFSFGVQAQAPDAATAQAESAQSLNAILAFLRESGVAENDIKTENYSLNPRYRWEERACVGGICPGGQQILDGYEVSQQVTVKVRDLDQSGALISGAGERGATNVSSLAFTIDDPANLETEARSMAIADAKAQAEQLAEDLGVTIVKMQHFYEESQNPGYPEPYMMERSMMASDQALVPEMPTGENTITSRVNISYEVK